MHIIHLEITKSGLQKGATMVILDVWGVPADYSPPIHRAVGHFLEMVFAVNSTSFLVSYSTRDQMACSSSIVTPNRFQHIAQTTSNLHRKFSAHSAGSYIAIAIHIRSYRSPSRYPAPLPMIPLVSLWRWQLQGLFFKTPRLSFSWLSLSVNSWLSERPVIIMTMMVPIKEGSKVTNGNV